MRRKLPISVIFGVGLIGAFFLDGSISQVCSSFFFNYPNTLVPCLTPLWLSFAVFFGDGQKLHVEIWAAVIGAFFDLFYLGIFGVYVFIFPLMVYLSRAIYQSLLQNFLSSFLIFFLNITVVVSMSYLAGSFIGIAQVSVTQFMVNMLGPTLALNLLFLAITYFPVANLYRNHRM